MAKTQLIVEVEEWTDRSVWLDGETFHDRKRLCVTVWATQGGGPIQESYFQWQYGNGRDPESLAREYDYYKSRVIARAIARATEVKG